MKKTSKNICSYWG